MGGKGARRTVDETVVFCVLFRTAIFAVRIFFFKEEVMKRKLGVLLCGILLAVSSLCWFVACKGGEAKAVVLKSVTETLVVMQVVEADEGATALDALTKLKEDGEVDFTSVNGLYGAYVTSINGKAETSEGTSGYSWMLYTSDTEFSSVEFGSVDYDGKTFGQASVGASALVVKEGEYYVWSYTYWAY